MLFDPHPHWLEVAHVAHRLSFSQGFVRKLIRAGKLKATRFESRWRVDTRDLDAYIERCQRSIAQREQAIDQLLSTTTKHLRVLQAHTEKAST